MSATAQTGAAAIRELGAGETHLAHQAMRALRTAYEDEQRFVEHVDRVLRLEKLADPDAVPDSLYGDMLVLIFQALEALARENPSAADPGTGSSLQEPAAEKQGAKDG
jgi:hypothetical protein